jgi:hypothetical protein
MNSGANAHKNTKYLAILFGGGTFNVIDLGGNGWSMVRIQNALAAAGYANAEIQALFTGGAKAAKAVNLNNIGADTTFKDMAAAWKFVKTKTDADTQIFYWSNWGHGTTWTDAAGKNKFKDAQAAKKGLAFTMDLSDAASQVFLDNLVDTYNYWATNGNDPATLPYFEVVSDLAVSNLSVTLNNQALTQTTNNVMDVLDDGTEIKYEYRFAMAQSDILLLSGSNQLVLDYTSGGSTNGDLSFLEAGPALGDFANGPALQAIGVINIVPSPTGPILMWAGGWILQSAPAVEGPWTDATGAASPYTPSDSLPQEYFRLREP